MLIHQNMSSEHSSEDSSVHTEINTPSEFRVLINCEPSEDFSLNSSRESLCFSEISMKELLTPKEPTKHHASHPSTGSYITEHSKHQKEWEQLMTNQKPKKPNRIDLAKRFSVHQVKLKEKLELLLTEQNKQNAESCPFQPNSFKKQSRGTLQQFLKGQSDFLKNKERRIEGLREEKERDELSVENSHHPCICEKSLRMTKCREFSRVDSSTRRLSHVEETTQFIPAVNAKSRKLLRKESVDSILYKDALRRQHRAPAVPKPVSFTVTRESHRLLLDKFSKEFDAAYDSVDLRGSGAFNYNQFSLFLEKFGCVRNRANSTDERALTVRAWELLLEREESCVKRHNLATFILCLLELRPHAAADTTETSLGGLVGSQFVASPEEARRLHLAFHLFYLNKRPLQAQRRLPPAHSFKPELSRSTQSLARKKRTKEYGALKREEVFKAEEQRRLAKLAKQKEDFGEETMKECTFRPQTNSSYRGTAQLKEGTLASLWKKLTESTSCSRTEGLYQLAKIKQEHDKKTQENKPETTPVECTFTPNTSKPQAANWKKHLEIRGVDQMIKRMKNGRKKQVAKKTMKLRSPLTHTPPKKHKSCKQLKKQPRDVHNSNDSLG